MSYLLNMFGMGEDVVPQQGTLQYFGTGADGSVRPLATSGSISIAVSPPIMAPPTSMPPTPAPAYPDAGMKIPTPILIGGAALALYLLFKKG